MDVHQIGAEQIEELKSNKDLSANERASSIAQIMRSFAHGKTNSSLRTIFVTCNSMIGSGCLLLPLLFKQSGIFTGIIAIFVIGIIQSKTCQLLVLHVHKDEDDVTLTIIRLLGRKAFYLYSIGAGTLLALVSLAYFLLTCNMFYHIMAFILDKCSYTYGQPGEVVFDRFSYTYLTIILIVVFFALANLKSLRLIIKIGAFGFYSILGYAVFIIYISSKNLSGGVLSTHYKKEHNLDGVTLFTSNFYYLFGTVMFFFGFHPQAPAIYHQNKFQEKNNRDIFVSFLITAALYCFLGLMGYLGIYGLSLPDGVSQANTVLDYFQPDDIATLIVSILFFYHLLTAFPCLLYIARSILLSLKYITSPVPKLVFHTYNILFLGACIACGIFNVNPGIVISVAGAIIGVNILYFFPIALHFKCLYSGEKKISQEKDLESANLQEKLMENPTYNEDDIEAYLNTGEKCDHDQYITKLTKNQRFIVYGFVVLFGLMLFSNQIYQFIKGL